MKRSTTRLRPKVHVLRLRKRQQDRRLLTPAVSQRTPVSFFSSPAKNYEMAYSNDTTHLNSRDIRLEFQPSFRILLYYITVHYTILYYITLYYIILYYIILYYINIL